MSVAAADARLSELARVRAADPAMLALARRLAARAAARYHAPADALESAAMLGLCRAAGSFDPAIGVKFAMYAGRRILGAMADEARAWSGRPGSFRSRHRTVSIEEPVIVGRDGDVLRIGDLLDSGEEQPFAAVDSADAVAGLAARLPSRPARLVRLLYGDCRAITMAKAGAILGIHQTYVSQIHQRAMRMLRDRLTDEDPRYQELMRRRAGRNGDGAPAPEVEAAGPDPAPDASPDPAPPPPPAARKLDAAGAADVRRLAAENPGWSSSDLADAFEGEHGWRPTYQAIGRCLADPAPRKATGRKPGRPRAAEGDPVASAARPGPDAEVGAIAALSRALAPLTPGEVRRVLQWARARFEAGAGAGEGGGSP